MTDSSLWRRFESSEGHFYRAARFVLCVAAIFLLCFTATLELTWPEQVVLGLLTVLIVIWLDRSSGSRAITLMLMVVSIFSTFRYGFWRLVTVTQYFSDPGSKWSGLDAFFIFMLLAAEAYAAAVLLMGYVQTAWPLGRMPAPLPEDPAEWPAIDLLIPTYNEPLSVVKHTALAAMNIDWPIGKLNVYILDDGRREEFRKFAEERGIGYITRDDNVHAKAGNINHALAQVDAPYVAVFDCDHVPTRSFMQMTMGLFLGEERLGMVQTPHHFYSPDPFERNLRQFRSVPNEGELFYGVVQDGNDFWNAAFFCGSCAVIRRKALDEAGGMAVETVTEDAHTSLRMQMRGWNTAYVNIPQAAGLATERLSGHVRQRIRWARGMVQVLRTDNPLFAPGLTTAQRLCYFNAMTHFLYALPRLIFLTAPLIYLMLGHVNIPGYWAAILAYALPHLVLANLTNSRIQGRHRHSFWNEIYETVLAPYILLPTLFALISPKLGKFNVTAKGGVVNRRFFDVRIAQPFLLLFGMNLAGVLCAIPRFWQVPASGHNWAMNVLAGMYDGHHPGTIVMNLLWACFNLMILGVAIAVAWEERQRRQSVRIRMHLPAEVKLPGGSSVHGVTQDISSGGLVMRMERGCKAKAGDRIWVTLPVLNGSTVFPAVIAGVDGGILRAQFGPLSVQEEEALTLVLYSRADAWLGWGEAREADRPLKSLGHILRLSLRGVGQTLRAMTGTAKSGAAAGVVLLMLVASGTLRGQVSAATAQPVEAQTTALPGAFDRTMTLADLGAPGAIVMRGEDSHHTVRFSLPLTEHVNTAVLKLHYHFSPGLLPNVSHLNVSLNGMLVATLTVAPPPVVTATTVKVPIESGDADAASNESSPVLDASITLPAELLARDNDLSFEFIGHYKAECEDPANSTLWSRVDAASGIALTGVLEPLRNDLRQLPIPFYDAAVDRHPSIPIVFWGQPSNQALEAAGVVASWFGVLADSRPMRFPVSVGTLPAGNAIVLSENEAALPPELRVQGGAGPVIAMRDNPRDPYSKVLVIAGANADQLLTAARALALQRNLLDGEQVYIKSLTMTAPRRPDDAPRWLSTEKVTPLGDFAQPVDLGSDGGAPVTVYLRLPPDLYYGTRQNLGLHLHYRYNGVPLGEGSTLQVSMNGAFVSAAPMPHSDKSAAEPEALVPVPVSDMRPSSNTLRMKFAWHAAGDTGDTKCSDVVATDLKGSVLRDSYLDLRGIPHWAVLPNLEIFANAGYPFTRKADLSDTAVVLPDAPAPEEMELYLTLMGHFGAETGYPVLNVSVTNAEGMMPGGKDYLVIGTVNDQAAIARLNPSLPVMVDGSGLHIQDMQGFFNQFAHAWWKVRSADRVQSGQLETSGGLPDALMEATEWPAHSGHSAVLILVRDKTNVGGLISAFLDDAQSSDISQTVSVLHGGQFSSYRIGSVMYGVGSLSIWVRTHIFFANYPWAMAALVALCAILLAVLLRAVLRRKAYARLHGKKD